VINLSLPWWEFIVRALVVYAFLLISLRLTGKRQIGELAPFDFVLLLVLSNAVQNSMNGGDNSLIGGLISATALVILNYGLGWLSFKNKKAASWIEGAPEVLIYNGKLFKDTVTKEQITQHELDAALRQSDCYSVNEVHIAILENNGAITVKKKDLPKP
jgi:uncharacterized membrane protein YcaP (DUF421 family)